MSTTLAALPEEFLPRDTADVVRTVRDSRPQPLTVYGGEPTGEDELGPPDRRVVLSLRRMNRVQAVDADARLVRVQAGARLSDIDRTLGAHGLGLPVVGDHREITAGGFAAVGGLSGASHRYGMFSDNVVSLEYVDPEGRFGTCGRAHHTDRFRRILGSGGRAGIITALTLEAVEVDKDRTWLTSDAHRFLDFDTFVEHSLAEIVRPGDAMLQVGRWVDTAPLRVSRPVGTGNIQLGTVRFGQWSSLHPTAATPSLRARRELGARARKSLGAIASAAKGPAGMPVRNAAAGALMFAPKVLTLRDAEYLADTVITSSERGPAYRVGVFAPLSTYTAVFHRLHDMLTDHRERGGVFTVISALTYGVRSPYLHELSGEDHGFISFTCRLRPIGTYSGKSGTPDVLRDIDSGIDDILRAERARRYHAAD
ncbi:FAD-binding oxidoreductase [Nocardia pseudobrasiliensis]|uniref:FAD/FMN-containing dehydrogenase n=1 Tax=Nocardia pseudobrasiliensis TaxID=45979 RepID=A0A370I7E0_9NOCA|nr:FAD-binding oxidoreductase [Nocardia pseudobrasiliensis]RDI65254.1 FAD/FMN-containing dehydrogenase [Nocardia pseudobrasiliensis]